MRSQSNRRNVRLALSVVILSAWGCGSNTSTLTVADTVEDVSQTDVDAETADTSASSDMASPQDVPGNVPKDITSPEDAVSLDDIAFPDALQPPDVGTEDTEQAKPLFSKFEVSPNPNNTLSALVSVETTDDVAVQVSFEAEGVGSFLTGFTKVGTAHSVTVVGMRQETTYTLTVQALVDGEMKSAPEATFTTGKVPGIVPSFEVTVYDADLVSPGITLFGLATDTDDPNEPLYLGVDEAGEIVWYYNDLDVAHDNTDREARLLPDGRLLLSLKTGYRLIDLAGNTLGELKGGPKVGSGLHHDAILLTNGNFAALGTEQQTVNVPVLGGDALLRGDTIVELDENNDVQWKWSAFDHLDTQSFPGQLAKKKNNKKGDHDWTHANALQLVDNGDALIMSLRHQHEVVKIDRATGEVVWRLGAFGDFELTNGEWFYAQHAPELYDDGRIFIYDNGNERPNSPPNYTRGVMYQLDFDAMTATQMWSYTCPEYGSFLGDIDLLASGNVLVTNGGIRLQGQGAPPGDGRLLEVTQEAEPKLVWELIAKEAFIYRSERITSFWP